METIKQTTNLEFDVIYADGTRKRVNEGVLFEAEASGDMVFHNGTNKAPVLLAAAECVLVSLLQVELALESLVIGMALTEEPCAALIRIIKCASALLGPGRAETQACFRLGQMDMRESIASKLQDAAGNAQGIVRATLAAAAAEVSEMEVME